MHSVLRSYFSKQLKEYHYNSLPQLFREDIKPFSIEFVFSQFIDSVGLFNKQFEREQTTSKKKSIANTNRKFEITGILALTKWPYYCPHLAWSDVSLAPPPHKYTIYYTLLIKVNMVIMCLLPEDRNLSPIDWSQTFNDLLLHTISNKEYMLDRSLFAVKSQEQKREMLFNTSTVRNVLFPTFNIKYKRKQDHNITRKLQLLIESYRLFMDYFSLLDSSFNASDEYLLNNGITDKYGVPRSLVESLKPRYEYDPIGYVLPIDFRFAKFKTNIYYGESSTRELSRYYSNSNIERETIKFIPKFDKHMGSHRRLKNKRMSYLRRKKLTNNLRNQVDKPCPYDWPDKIDKSFKTFHDKIIKAWSYENKAHQCDFEVKGQYTNQTLALIFRCENPNSELLNDLPFIDIHRPVFINNLISVGDNPGDIYHIKGGYWYGFNDYKKNYIKQEQLKHDKNMPLVFNWLLKRRISEFKEKHRVLRVFGRFIFKEFMQTVHDLESCSIAWKRQLMRQTRRKLITQMPKAFCDKYTDILCSTEPGKEWFGNGDMQHNIGNITGIVGRRRRQSKVRTYYYIIAALLRVFVAETLHSYEQKEKRDTRYHLRVFITQHISFLDYVTRTNIDECDDWALEQGIVNEQRMVMSNITRYMPCEASSIHEGMLANLATSYNYVNLFSKGTEYPWNKMKYKLVDKVNSKGNISKYQVETSRDHAMYFELSCAEILVSMLGVYRHAYYIPHFKEYMLMYRLFGKPYRHKNRSTIIDFFAQYPDITKTLLAECITFTLKFNPILHRKLKSIYPWEDYKNKVECKSDIIRYYLRNNGTLIGIENGMFKGSLALKGRTVYRHSGHTFVEVINQLIDETMRTIIKRPRSPTEIPKRFLLTKQQKILISRMVPQMTLARNIDINMLTYPEIGMSEKGVETIKILYKRYQKKRTKKDFRKHLNDMRIRDFVIIKYVFDLLRSYVHYRVVDICDNKFVAQQILALRELYEIPNNRHMTGVIGTFIVSSCCKKIITGLPNSRLSPVSGHIKMFYDMINKRYVCGKNTDNNRHSDSTLLQKKIQDSQGQWVDNPEHYSRLIAKSRCSNLGKKERDKEINVIASGVIKKEKLRRCIDTEPIIESLIGKIVSATNSKIKLSKKNRDPNTYIPPKKSRMTIMPCCGNIHWFEISSMTYLGYLCGYCEDTYELAPLFKAPLCVSCFAPKPENVQWFITYIFDDMMTFTFRMCVICPLCNFRGWIRGYTFKNKVLKISEIDGTRLLHSQNQRYSSTVLTPNRRHSIRFWERYARRGCFSVAYPPKKK